MRRLLTLDPGIDITGYAFWDVEHLTRPLLLQDASHRLLAYGSLRTDPADPLDRRLLALREQFLALAVHGSPREHRVLIERPPYDGTYRRHQGRARPGKDSPVLVSLAPMYAAMGCLLATAASVGAAVAFVPASGTPKPMRHALVRQIWPQLGQTNADERDAISLGLTALSDPARRWMLNSLPSATSRPSRIDGAIR